MGRPEPRAATAALRNRFEGVGLPEHTEIFIPGPHRNDEWWSRDKRYWMAMRTFMTREAVPPDRAEGLILNRLRFLREKLISDLQLGEKIFAYKNMFRNLSHEELADLYLAVRWYGDSTLLYIRYEGDSHPAGSVVRLAPGLLVGAVEHFSFSPDDKPLDPPNDCFLSICRTALQLWRRSDMAGPSEPVAQFNAALANSLARQGRIDDALAAARLAAQSEPGNPQCQHQLALLLLRAGRSAEAEAAARAAVSAAPQIGAYQDTLAHVLKQQGRPDQAVQAAQLAAALEPADADRQLGLARSLLELGRLDEAEAAALRVIYLDPAQVGAYDVLAGVMEKTNSLAASRGRDAACPAIDPGRCWKTSPSCARPDAVRRPAGSRAGAACDGTARGSDRHLPSPSLAGHHPAGFKGRLHEAIVEARLASEAAPDNADLRARVVCWPTANKMREDELAARIAKPDQAEDTDPGGDSDDVAERSAGLATAPWGDARVAVRCRSATISISAGNSTTNWSKYRKRSIAATGSGHRTVGEGPLRTSPILRIFLERVLNLSEHVALR